MTTTVPIASPGWLRALRTVLIAQTSLVLLAAVAAGILLTFHMTALHSATAYALWSIAVVGVVVGILSWRPGHGSGWPAVFATAFLIAASLQVFLGIAHLTAFHVPLGVLLFAGSLLETVWLCMPARVRTAPR